MSKAMEESFQSMINSKRNGAVDYEMLKMHLDDKQYIETTWNQINVGDRVKYVFMDYGFNSNHVEKFRSGGIVLKKVDENFQERMIIKAYNGETFALKKANMVHIYKNDAPAKYKVPNPDNKFKLYIGNTLVYATNEKYRYDRAKNTQKYQNAVKTGKFILIN